MPTYDYECPKCKATIEIRASITHVPPMCCEADCNVPMEKVISTTNFILKGGGWAKDGYSSKKEE